MPVADQVGTIWGWPNTSAAKANAYQYDAFGVGRAESETVPNRYRFGTKRLDADTGLYHFIARQYMPDLGRRASPIWHRLISAGNLVYAAAASPLTPGTPAETNETAKSQIIKAIGDFLKDLAGKDPDVASCFGIDDLRAMLTGYLQGVEESRFGYGDDAVHAHCPN